MHDELDEWLSEEETAAAIKKSVRTLRQWRRRGIGPPYARFGRTVKYRKPSLVEHFRKTEINPVRARLDRTLRRLRNRERARWSPR